MKKLLTILAICFSIATSFAQGATLTKEETVNYIDKKANEIFGHYRTVPLADKKNYKFYYSRSTVSMYGDKLTFEQRRRNYKDGAQDYRYYPCNYVEVKYEYTFNPGHIVSVEKYLNHIEGEPVGVIKITLKAVGISTTYMFGTTEKVRNEYSEHYGKCFDLKEYTDYRESESATEIYLAYLQSDDSNFTKIKKALEYLRDLAKAEDDPFGN